MKQKQTVVFVTRPKEVIKQTVDYFNHAGFTTIAAPLIKRVVNSQDGIRTCLKQIQNSPVIVFPSVASVDYCFQLMPNFKPSLQTKIIAVGPASENRWYTYANTKVHLARPHNSDGMIQYIESIAKPASIAVITAPDGREAIKRYCHKHEIDYIPVYVYQRIFIPLSKPVMRSLKDNSIQHVLCFTSMGALNYFYTLIGTDMKESVGIFLSSCQLVTASERITEAAKGLGFIHVITAQSADDKDMCLALLELQEIG